MAAISDLRPSPIAGQWYPGDARALEALIDRCLQGASLPELNGEVMGVIAPHAGIRYSGAVAGYAFRAAQRRAPELVAVISPSHQPYYAPVLSSAHAAYSTPLGAVEVDRDALAALDEALDAEIGYHVYRVARDQEHSLEIELPFLQRIYPDGFRLLPVMLMEQSARLAQALGKALAQVLAGKNSLLVASTDLSHFYPATIAAEMDGEMLRQMEAFSPEGLLEAERGGRGQACGVGAVAATLWAGRTLGADTVKVLHYSTSGVVTGDLSSVVGYGAAVMLKTQ